MGSSVLAVLSPETVADILQKLADIDSAINDGVSLRPTDRRKLLKLGRKTTQFVQRTIEMTQQNPEMVPPYIDRASMESNYQVYNQMLNLVHVVDQLKRKLEDRLLASGSYAHTVSLSCYKAIKNASADNVPGAEPVYAALKTRFKPVKRKSGTPDPGQDPEALAG